MLFPLSKNLLGQLNSPWEKICFLLGTIIFGQLIFAPPLMAYSVAENKIFAIGPYAFKLELQVAGKGSFKKNPALPVSSLKVKIKNERASSEILKLKAIRIFQEAEVYQDIETQGFIISPGKWVTKFYRLSRRVNVLVTKRGFIAMEFENFSIRFYPWEKKFQGPLEKST